MNFEFGAVIQQALPDSDGYGEPFVGVRLVLRGAGAHEHVARAQALGGGGRQARPAARAAEGRVAPQQRQRQLARRRLALRRRAAHMH